MYLDPGSDAEGLVMTVDPYRGKELGDARTANRFVNSVHQFHTHLLMDKHRDAAKLVLGVASLFLLFLSCSGIILWWPRRLFRINWRGGGKRVIFDLHNVLGILSSLFLFCFALTGTAMTWEGPVNNQLNRVFHSGTQAERRRMSPPPDGAVALNPDVIIAAAHAHRVLPLRLSKSSSTLVRSSQVFLCAFRASRAFNRLGPGSEACGLG